MDNVKNISGNDAGLAALLELLLFGDAKQRGEGECGCRRDVGDSTSVGRVAPSSGAKSRGGNGDDLGRGGASRNGEVGDDGRAAAMAASAPAPMDVDPTPTRRQQAQIHNAHALGTIISVVSEAMEMMSTMDHAVVERGNMLVIAPSGCVDVTEDDGLSLGRQLSNAMDVMEELRMTAEVLSGRLRRLRGQITPYNTW